MPSPCPCRGCVVSYKAGYSVAILDAAEAVRTVMESNGWDETTIATTVATVERLTDG